MIQKIVMLLALIPTIAYLGGNDSHIKKISNIPVEIEAEIKTGTELEVNRALDNGQVTITFSKGTDTIKNAEGVFLLSVDSQFPIIKIEGNQAATDKVNAYYKEIQKQFDQTVEKLLGNAKADYDSRTKEQLAYWNGYAVSTQYEKARIDDKVISLVNHYYEFTGGAHPNSSRWAENFATSTGKYLTLKDVVKDEMQARKDIEAYILKLTKNPQYKDYFFEGYEAHIPELLTDNTWYFSDEGFVVIANEYIIGPHVVGILEFTIPYSDAVFLKDAYRK